MFVRDGGIWSRVRKLSIGVLRERGRRASVPRLLRAKRCVSFVVCNSKKRVRANIYVCRAPCPPSHYSQINGDGKQEKPKVYLSAV